MQILITGATGFIGRAIRDYPYRDMMGQGCRTTNLSHRDYDDQGWEKLRWDAIIHLAHTPPDRVIQCAKFFGTPVLFASSGAVYHDHPNTYGLEKRAWEDQLLESGVNVRIARIFTTCGRYMNWDTFAVGNFVRDAWAGLPIKILGNGNIVRSYLYRTDVAGWLWSILHHGQKGCTYDVGSPWRVTIREVAEKVRSNFRLPPKIMIENKIKHEQAPVYLPHRAATAMMELDLSIYFSLDDAIRQTVVDYALDHPDCDINRLTP